MPYLDGVELARKLRKEPFNFKIRIVLISAED